MTLLTLAPALAGSCLSYSFLLSLLPRRVGLAGNTAEAAFASRRATRLSDSARLRLAGADAPLLVLRAAASIA